MALLTCAPGRTLVDHPEFPLMLARTLDRFHCTLPEVREDYWLGRAWRALAVDDALRGRVARLGISQVLITGPGFTASATGRERQRWLERVRERVRVDTSHTLEALGLEVRFAEAPVEVAQGCILSLLAQTVAGDDRWDDIRAYAGDLTAVIMPVVYSMETVVAA